MATDSKPNPAPVPESGPGRQQKAKKAELNRKVLRAAAGDNPENIWDLFDKGADISAVTKTGNTLLHVLINNDEASDADIIRFIGKTNPRLRNRFGSVKETPLYLACKSKRPKIVLELLKAGVDVSKPCPDNFGRTPLHCCALKGYYDLAKTLLDFGADINAPNTEEGTPLDDACWKENMKVAELLIQKGADVQRADRDGWPPLHTTCRYGFSKLSQLLLDNGADVHFRDNNRAPAIWIASKFGHAECLELLIERGANVDDKNVDGVGPLDIACHKGRENSVRILLERGADVNITDDKGWTPLITASRYGMENIVKHLLTYNPDLDKTKSDGRSAIMSASYQGQVEIVRLLIHAGAKFDEPDEDGWTPLMFAVKDELSIKVFVENGADLSRRTFENHGRKTVLHLAAGNDNAAMTELLLTRMTPEDQRARDEDGKTALRVAIEKQNADTVQQLLEDMQVADFGEDDMEDAALEWAAASEKTHEIVRLLFVHSLNRPAFSDKLQQECKRWSAIEWAAYMGKPLVLWQLLCNRGTNTTTEEHKAIELAEHAKAVAMKPRVGSKNNTPIQEKCDDATDGAADGEQFDMILRMLKTPPITYTTKAGEVAVSSGQYKAPVYRQYSTAHVENLEASVLGFYANGEHSAFLRRKVPVYELIYGKGDSGPDSIMKEAANSVDDITSKLGLSARDKVEGENLKETVHAAENRQLCWVHLPATNIRWMNDLMLRIYFDSEKKKQSYLDMDGFFRKTWTEVPDKLTSSRYMSPTIKSRASLKKRKKRKTKAKKESDSSSGSDSSSESDSGSGSSSDDGDGDGSSSETGRSVVTAVSSASEAENSSDSDSGEEESASFKPTAVYMPFFTFATEHLDDQWTASSKRYYELLDGCKGDTIHGSRTLDEFQYSFTSGESQSSDLGDRNRDQVVSKEIHNVREGGRLPSTWTLVRIDQVWIWVIDKKYVISASTHRKDDACDPVFAAVMDYFDRVNEKGERASQPSTGLEMSKIIVDCCVSFFRQRQVHDSIYQLFSKSINKTAAAEADLFKSFIESKFQQARNTYRENAMKEAAYLFRHIKDVREELGILRAVARHQQGIQNRLSQLVSKSARADPRNVQNITFMEETADRILAAVNTTLTFAQNELSISQAQEGVRQGRTLMVFTVVTIIFLPMSFLTSFFAVDVASFARTPHWTFIVIFITPMVLFVPLALYALYSDEVDRTFQRAFTRKSRQPTTAEMYATAEREDGMAIPSRASTRSSYGSSRQDTQKKERETRRRSTWRTPTKRLTDLESQRRSREG